MLRKSLLILLFLAGNIGSAASAQPADDRPPAVPDTDYDVLVGSAAINQAAIEPYHAVWTTGMGLIEERLNFESDGAIRHEQRTYAPLSRETADQVAREDQYLAVVETRLLARDTLASRYLLRDQLRTPRDPAAARRIEIAADPAGYAGLATRANGEIHSWQLRTGRESFDGWIAGLAIAALPLEIGYQASLPTVTHLFRGSHTLTVNVVGRSQVTVGTGEIIDCWEVEASWLDHGTGDVYPPGRDGSGGTYNIAVTPGGGVPYVVEYASQGSVILWDGVRRPTAD